MSTQENAVIRKCAEAEITRIGEFYDRIIIWLDNHVNYPRWIYGVYPSAGSAIISPYKTNMAAYIYRTNRTY